MRNNFGQKVKDALWWIVGLLSVIALIVLLVYQASTPDRLSRYQTHKPLTVIDNSVSPPRKMTLMVVYPTKLLLQEMSETGRPVQVWLSDPKAGKLPRTYNVFLEPLADGLVFTDENGTPVTPSAVLNATEFPFESSSWFLHRTPSIARQPTSVKVTLSVMTLEDVGLKDVDLKVDPSTVSIELETPRSAFWRHFFDLACGSPIIPFLGFAFSLTVWSWNERNRQRQVEKEHEKERRELGSEMTRLDSLWATNPTEAVQRYLDLCNQARADQLTEVVFQNCNQERWQVRIEQEAIASLARGDYDMAHKLAQVLCKEAATDDTNTVCSILSLLSNPKPPVEERLYALIALAASRGDLLPETLVQKLTDTFADTLLEEGALEKFVMKLRNQIAADWLLATQSVQHLLLDWIKEERTGWHLAEQLRNRAFKGITWPALWPLTYTTVEPEQSTAKVVKTLHWPVNPFGPDRVEYETRPLIDLWVPPAAWDDLLSSDLAVLVSTPGAGQTFALRYLLQVHSERWRNIHVRSVTAERLLFPVLLDHNELLLISTREECVGEIAFAIGQALLHFLALNPSLFEQSTPPAQRAIARLLLACQQRLGDLQVYIKQYLADNDQPSSKAPLWLPILLHGAAAGAQPLALDHPAEVLFVLKNIRLATSRGFVVAVDLPVRLFARPEAALLNRLLPPLIELMPKLAACGVYLMLGLPTMADPSVIDAIESKSIPLGKWSDKELTTLLEKRLLRSPGFDDLMNPGEATPPSKWIVERSQGSPQRLVRLGNHLLVILGNKSPGEKLLEQDLLDAEAIL